MTILSISLQILKNFFSKDLHCIMKSSYTYMYIQFFFRYISKSQRYTNYLNLSIFLGTVQVCPVRNMWSLKYLSIYIVQKNAFKLICNINMFFFSSERQDAQGRGRRRPSYKDLHANPIHEDHLRLQHLRDVRRGLPTPHPHQTKKSPKGQGKSGGRSGGRGSHRGQGGFGGRGGYRGRGSSSHGPALLIFSIFLTTRNFFLTFLFCRFFVLSLFSKKKKLFFRGI